MLVRKYIYLRKEQRLFERLNYSNQNYFKFIKTGNDTIFEWPCHKFVLDDIRVVAPHQMYFVKYTMWIRYDADTSKNQPIPIRYEMQKSDPKRGYDYEKYSISYHSYEPNISFEENDLDMLFDVQKGTPISKYSSCTF